MKSKMGRGVEAGLRKVEDSSEADDEAVDFAEGGEAEDFGGVVAVVMLVWQLEVQYLVKGLSTL